MSTRSAADPAQQAVRSASDPTYNSAMGTFTRKRRRHVGLWILTAILMKMVGPAFSHVLVPGASINDRWIVAVCTATGLKYIDIRPELTAQGGEPSEPDSTTEAHRSAEHCLLCTATHHEALTTSDRNGVVSSLDQSHCTPELHASKPARADRWPHAHPRAPPSA